MAACNLSCQTNVNSTTFASVMSRSRSIKLQNTDSQHFEHPELDPAPAHSDICVLFHPTALTAGFFSGYFCKRALVLK